MIAIAAGGDHVGPVLSAKLGRWHHVIEREKFCGELGSTILAGEGVAKVDVFSRKLDARDFSWRDVFFQSEHTRKSKVLLHTSGADRMVIQDFNFSLEPETQGFLPADKFERLTT